MVNNPKRTFALKVRGVSMIEDCIASGDTILVEERGWADDGETVVASVEGELTLKRFYREKDCIRLQPANESLEPILVHGEIEILGVLVGLLRRYR